MIYFKFLVASMGIEGLSIPPDSEEIRKIVAAVYQEEHFLDAAINQFLSAVCIKTTGINNRLYGLQLSPFYQIVLQAIKMLPEEKQAKIFES